MKNERQDDVVFDYYKPFRNQLRKFELLDSLYLIWGYSRNFTFNLPFPEDIEKPGNFRSNDTLDRRRNYGIPEFEQALLLKEIILNASTIRNADFTLRNKDRQAALVNYMRHTLSEKIDRRFTMGDDIILNFNRLFHRQFQWQHGFNKNIIYRYYQIFAHPAVEPLVNNVYQLTVLQLFLIGFFFFRSTADNFRTQLPYLSQTPVLTNEMIERFFELFSISLADAKEQISAYQEMNENLFYSYNPLFAKPILLYENSFICPIPILLFWQFTSGTYYAIVNEPGFNHAFGASFEAYVGDVIRKFNAAGWDIYPEHTYGRQEKRSVDWLVTDADTVLFIECKTKRMTQPAKTFLGLSDQLKADLRTVAGYVVQVYKTYLDYADNRYGFIAYDAQKRFIPLVLTLESWYFEYNSSMRDIVREYVVGLFNEQGIDLALLDRSPYILMSCQEFELDFQIMQSVGLSNYFDRHFAMTLHEITTDFPYQNLITEAEFTELFLSPFRE